MKAKDLRGQTPKDLLRALTDAEEQLRSLQFSLAANQLKKVRDIRNTKRTIARLKTELRRKEMEAQTSEETSS